VITRATAVTVLAISTTALAGGKLEPDDLPGPQPEVTTSPAKVAVPPVPAFELPASEPGFHGPRELRVRGKSVLGTEIKVKGYVTWIYNCAAALAASNPKATQAQILVSIDNDPTLCERPKLYLGDTKATPADASIWVVDVPRPPSKREREQAPKTGAPAWPAVPKVAVGDFVVVSGTWATESPHGEHNTSGLLIYRGLDRANPATAPAAATAPDVAPEPDVAIVTKPPLRAHVANDARDASISHLNSCIKSINARKLDSAIAACEASVQAWDGNHLAWYTLASAHMAKSEWPQAQAAVEHAVAQRPDQGMYQLYYGISLYEALHASKVAKPPADPVPTAAPPTLDQARDALRRATKLAPELWRAHYYLGRAYRDVDDAKHAAEQFAQTIATHPVYAPGYIALTELYRRWGYVDEALAVATLGTANVPASDAADVWFELGMAQDAKHADAAAIEAFSKAIAGKPNDPTPKFQRGQLYYKKGDFAGAKRDLDDVAQSTDPRSATMKPIATQLLAKIASKPH